MSRVLTVQTVLFGESADAIARAVDGVRHGVAVARHHGLVGDVVLAHGDAAASPRTDAELARFAELAGEVEYHYEFFDENTGSARGQNRLAARWPATWHLTTNPDVVFGGSALAHLLARGDDPAVAAVEARQLPVELAKWYDPDTGDTSWATGACTMIRGDVWRALDGYDDAHFFLYGDDVDFSWRIRHAGHRVVHVPEARAFHAKRIDPDAEPSEFEVYHSAMAAWLLAARWGDDDDRERVRIHQSGPRYKSVREAIARIEAEGRAPTPIEGRERVGSFMDDGHFGLRRF